MVSGAARSQLYDGVGVGLFILHHLESYQDDGNVGASYCDDLYVPEPSGIFRVGSRIDQVNTTGIYRMAVEENLSFYGIGACL